MMKVLVGFDHLRLGEDNNIFQTSWAKVLVVGGLSSIPAAFIKFIDAEKAQWGLEEPKATITWYLPEERHEVCYL